MRAEVRAALARDHPRSRGVYPAKSKRYILLHGSSPLARGLRQVLNGNGDVGRIIPARAGFTVVIPALDPLPEDHPRSRGVYRGAMEGERAHVGSSPLARGLQDT